MRALLTPLLNCRNKFDNSFCQTLFKFVRIAHNLEDVRVGHL